MNVVLLQGTAATLKLELRLVLGHDLDTGDNNPPDTGSHENPLFVACPANCRRVAFARCPSENTDRGSEIHRKNDIS